MNRFTIFIGAALLAASIAQPAAAQQVQGMGILALDPVDEGNTVLTVTGQGNVRVTPDLVIFQAGVTTVAPSAEQALRDNAAKMQRVISALRRRGIATRDIQTRDVTIRPIMSDNSRSEFGPRSMRPVPVRIVTADAAEASAMADFEANMEAAESAAMGDSEEPRIVGYRAANVVVIRQRELGEFGQLIDALVGAGANEVEGPDFRLENQEAVLDEARAKAIAESRRRADLHAAAAGLRVVRIIMMDEGRNSGLSSRRSGTEFGFWEAMEQSGYGPMTPTEVGELTVSSTMGVMYELAPR